MIFPGRPLYRSAVMAEEDLDRARQQSQSLPRMQKLGKGLLSPIPEEAASRMTSRLGWKKTIYKSNLT